MSQRILWIDDNVDMLANATPLLEAEGYRLITLNWPDNLPEALADACPDLIIVDLSFPGLGVDWSLLKRVKQLAPQTPTIVFSGYSFQSCQAQALALGACCYLVKPLRIRTLLDRIATLLGQQLPALS